MWITIHPQTARIDADMAEEAAAVVAAVEVAEEAVAAVEVDDLQDRQVLRMTLKMKLATASK